MSQPVPKIHASTQKFIEIQDIVDNIVVLQGGKACLVIEVTASNFTLLSKQEQDTKIFSYASLLNSLSFPIQILIRNERVDITSYLKELERAQKDTTNALLKKHIELYRSFVREMILVNVVLNKKFYVAISFSSLEAGVAGVTQAAQKGQSNKDASLQVAKKMLQTKADSILPQLSRVASSAKILEKEDLVKLFYDIYNHEIVDVTQAEADAKTAIISRQ